MARPLDRTATPLHALCGFDAIDHPDRSRSDGSPVREAVLDAICRHTRLVPREAIGIAGSIYSTSLPRTVEMVRQAVNERAAENTAYALATASEGWRDSHEGAIVSQFPGEVISRDWLLSSTSASSDARRAVALLLQIGLLGVSEPDRRRHRSFYTQRFSYRNPIGFDIVTHLTSDHYFVHPALKAWIRSRFGWNEKFMLVETGLIGDGLPYEAQPPIVRLGISTSGIRIDLRYGGSIIPLSVRQKQSDPVRFLYVALWACRELGRPCVTLEEFRVTHSRLRSNPRIGQYLKLAVGSDLETLAYKIVDWQKKVNRERGIRMLLSQIGSAAPQKLPPGAGRTIGGSRLPVAPFLSVTRRGSMRGQPEMALTYLPVDEIDWSDEVRDVGGISI